MKGRTHYRVIVFKLKIKDISGDPKSARVKQKHGYPNPRFSNMRVRNII